MLETFSWKRSGKWTISRKMARQKSKTNRKTREKIGKGNQMTALKFKTWENIRHHGLPSGARQGRTSDSLASFQGPDREEHQTAWLPFRGQTGKNIDILASLQRPEREEHQTSWPPFRKQNFFSKLCARG